MKTQTKTCGVQLKEDVINAYFRKEGICQVHILSFYLRKLEKAE